jgi:Ca2+-binding EF-hand superfamily protein
MKRFFVVPLIASISLFLPGAAEAGKEKAKDIDAMVDRVFARLDADKDNRISKQEAEKGPRLGKHFAKVDADKDGFVTRPELRAALERRGAGK